MQGALSPSNTWAISEKCCQGNAALSEQVTQSLADILHSSANHTNQPCYFASTVDNGPLSYWQIISEWRDPEKPTWVTNTRIFMKIPTNNYLFLRTSWRNKEKYQYHAIMPSPEKRLLAISECPFLFRYCLPGKNKLPSSSALMNWLWASLGTRK